VGVMQLQKDTVDFSIDIRQPVTLEPEETLHTLETCLQQNGFTTGARRISKGLYYPEDHPLIHTLLDAYRQVTQDETPPVAIGGGTYARCFTGAVAYGCVFPGQAETAHMADEFIAIKDLVTSARIFARAIYALGNL